MAGCPRRKPPPPPAPTGIIAARVRGALGRLTGRSAPRRARRSGRPHRPRARRRALWPSRGGGGCGGLRSLAGSVAAAGALRRCPGTGCRRRRCLLRPPASRRQPADSPQRPQAPPPARRPSRGPPPPPIGPPAPGAGHSRPAPPRLVPERGQVRARPRSRGRRRGARAAEAGPLPRPAGRLVGPWPCAAAPPRPRAWGKLRPKGGRTWPGHRSASRRGHGSNPGSGRPGAGGAHTAATARACPSDRVLTPASRRPAGLQGSGWKRVGAPQTTRVTWLRIAQHGPTSRRGVRALGTCSPPPPPARGFYDPPGALSPRPADLPGHVAALQPWHFPQAVPLA